MGVVLTVEFKTKINHGLIFLARVKIQSIYINVFVRELVSDRVSYRFPRVFWNMAIFIRLATEGPNRNRGEGRRHRGAPSTALVRV